MKELFVLAALLAVIIPISTYWGIFTEKIKMTDKVLVGNIGANVELCQSKYASNYPICGRLK